MTTVWLHIGCFKTGTSHIQRTMTANREALREEGVLWPGTSFGDQVDLAHYLKRGAEGARGTWQRVVSEIDAWDGPTAVVSMEFLSLVDADGVSRAIQTLSDHRVKVILGARDLERVIPAQWQESVQHRHDWSYRQYLEGLTGSAHQLNRAHRHFWKRHNWPGILSTWRRVAPDALTLLVVPPADAPRGLLWERFASVIGIQASRYAEPQAVNESLGAASAEVLRHAARSLNEGSYSAAAVRAKKRVLAKDLMASRKKQEPILVLPRELESWARAKTDELLAEIRRLEPAVAGELDELQPRFGRAPARAVSDPAALPADELLDAAGDALMKLCAELARTGSFDDD